VQYKVPQNIDLEDKIVGPFTMKQFIYLLVAGGIAYGWWNFLSQRYVGFMPAFLLVAAPVGLLGVALALVKVNDRPFEIFLLNLFRFIFMPKRRVWKEGYSGEAVIVLGAGEEDKAKIPIKDTRSLDDLAKGLEKQSTDLRQNEPAAKSKGFFGKIFKSGNEGAAHEGSKLQINLSVKDVDNAAAKQTQAQGTAAKLKIKDQNVK
jgi:hypothetical protein